MESRRGMTLLELMVGLAIVGVLSALVAPMFQEQIDNARYKKAAREVASAFRQARTRAINSNREHRVEFDLDGSDDALGRARFRITRGDRASGSTTFDDVVCDWTCFDPGVGLRRTSGCGSSSDVTMEFNPNGTGNAGYICITDRADPPAVKYRTAVLSSTTGRVVVLR